MVILACIVFWRVILVFVKWVFIAPKTKPVSENSDLSSLSLQKWQTTKATVSSNPPLEQPDGIQIKLLVKSTKHLAAPAKTAPTQQRRGIKPKKQKTNKQTKQKTHPTRNQIITPKQTKKQLLQIPSAQFPSPLSCFLGPKRLFCFQMSALGERLRNWRVAAAERPHRGQVAAPSREVLQRPLLWQMNRLLAQS